MRDSIKVPFSNLKITCDGKHTHIIIDGEDISRGCTEINFTHIAGEEPPKITVYKPVELIPRKNNSAD